MRIFGTFQGTSRQIKSVCCSGHCMMDNRISSSPCAKAIQLKFTHSRYKILVSYLSEPVCAEPQLLIPLFIDQEWCSTCTWIIILDLLRNYFGQKYWQMKYIFYHLGTYPTSLHVFTSYLLHILLFGENYLIWFFT